MVFITTAYDVSPSISDLMELKKHVNETLAENQTSLRKIRENLNILGQITDRLDRMVTVLKAR